MNPPTKKEMYLLDTNFLFDFALWIPIDLNKTFWSHLEASLEKGEWILLDVVVDEIRSKGPLKDWCDAQKKKGLVQAITDDHRKRGVEINNNHPMVDVSTGKSETDTYLLAYAEANKCTVVSRERQRDNGAELHKIPDVCTLLGISLIRQPRPFLERIGFKN